jgi:hypothetical protein
MRLLSRFDWLGQRSRPYYGQLVLWTLLACSGCLCFYFVWSWGEKRASDVRTPAPTSLLSFLPADWMVDHRWPIVACGVLFAVGAVLWSARRLVPYSSWLTALTFNAVVALYLEDSSQETHVGHVAGAFLLIYALWYHFYRCEIRSPDWRTFWRTPLYPRWVYSLSVFYLGLFYGLSGFNKLAVSGWSWPNGLSLQLWAELFGDRSSVFTRLILSSRTAAAAMQGAALLGECGGLVAIVSARLRPLVGLLLIAFHVAQICVFGWGFHANMLMVALVFLPAYQWTPRVGAWWEARRGTDRPPETLSREPQAGAFAERSPAARG